MAAEVSEDRVDLVAKQITVTKLLASNDPKIRSDGIKQMKQLLLSNSGDSSNGWFHLFTLLKIIYVRFIYCTIEIILKRLSLNQTIHMS